jgi:hypothetical protein
MTDLITLKTIKEIFDNAYCKISPMAKMLYISCLTNHFDKLEKTERNLVGFELIKSEILFDRDKGFFEELHKAGLVRLDYCSVYFLNHWAKSIDLSKVEKEKVNVSESQIRLYLNGHSFISLVCMNNSLSLEDIATLIDKFCIEQSALSKTYRNENECRLHFSNWIKYNKKKQDDRVVTKSKGKILGM